MYYRKGLVHRGKTSGRRRRWGVTQVNGVVAGHEAAEKYVAEVWDDETGVLVWRQEFQCKDTEGFFIEPGESPCYPNGWKQDVTALEAATAAAKKQAKSS